MRRAERLGAVASFACAIHCALVPILVGAGAAGAISWINHTPVEWGLVLIAAVIGTVTAWRGFRTHGNRAVAVTLVVAAIGLVVLTASHAGGDPAGEHAHGLPWFSATFGIALGASMLVDRRLCRTCTDCAAHD